MLELPGPVSVAGFGGQTRDGICGRVWGLPGPVSATGYGVWGLGFRVQGLGLWEWVLGLGRAGTARAGVCGRVRDLAEMWSGSEEGSCLRLIDCCITQL